MLKRIHDKLGTAGLVVAVVALVVAVAGTAFAAGGLTKKQEKQVVKIAKKYAGKDGAQGPKGDPGQAGSQGSKGDPGPKGDAGVPGNAGPEGKQGPAGPTETTLPPGKTETGVWGFRGINDEGYWVTLAFPLRLEEEIGLSVASQEPEFCPGTVAEPKAVRGSACLYSDLEHNAFLGGDAGTPDKSSGRLIEFQAINPAAESFGHGSWAVTARCPIDPKTNEELTEC
jgi:hypothetical protein